MDTDGYLRELYRIIDSMDQSLVLSQLEGLSPRIRTVLRFLEQNASDETGLGGPAGLVRMHPAALSRKMHRELRNLGCYLSLWDYRDMLRLRSARRASRSDPLLECKEVAALVGVSPRTLRRIFKRYTNSSPEDYRRSSYARRKS